MKLNKVREGIRVIIVKLGNTRGIMVKPTHLAVRQVGVTGTITRFVPGHGGDVWFVQHDKSTDIGVYVFDEFEEVEKNASPQ